MNGLINLMKNFDEWTGTPLTRLIPSHAYADQSPFALV